MLNANIQFFQTKLVSAESLLVDVWVDALNAQAEAGDADAIIEAAHKANQAIEGLRRVLHRQYIANEEAR